MCECGTCKCFDPYYGTYCELCSGTELCKRASCDVDGLNGMCAECVVNLLEVFNENNITGNELFTEEFVEASIQEQTLPQGSVLNLTDVVIYLPDSFSTECNESCPQLVIINQTSQVDYMIDGECIMSCRW